MTGGYLNLYVPLASNRRMLAHVGGATVEAAYRRGDLFQKRRQLADA
jgi:hypothetical protein